MTVFRFEMQPFHTLFLFYSNQLFKMLWKKESNGSTYTDIFGYGDKIRIENFVQTNIGRQNQKCNELSTELRLKGNEKFTAKVWREAMQFYNESLCHAEIGSKNISLAYANRSSCFLRLNMFEKCLADIELAIEAHYPVELMPKLDARRTNCLNQIQRATQIDKAYPKLDFEEDEHFPGMANVLQMECNAKYGRHIVAKCDIDVGKVVLADESFISMPVNSTKQMICSRCLKNTMNFIACDFCNSAMFCSHACAKSDEFHEISCGNIAAKEDYFVAYITRSIVIAINIFKNIDSLITFVESVINDESKGTPQSLKDMKSRYRAFLKSNLRMSDEKNNINKYRCTKIFECVMSQPTIKASVRSKHDIRFLMHLTMMHFYIVNCNLFENKIRSGVFLIQQLINHSCAPNLLYYHSSTKAIGITTRRIKKGDQIFIAYDQMFLTKPRDVRQRFLKGAFGFRCDCEKCSNDNWPISSLCIASDPKYNLLLKEIQNSTGTRLDNIDDSKRSIMKKTCFEIFKKYRNMHWTFELDVVCVNLAGLLLVSGCH
ncbi:SET and MYND domain-containing protein 4-like [Contarinia nasturtii]|uniref:SET and MYND domain-containing protein 4-like n=1 Tax=Contarinia nasturtii TaxID=265458 RepID=UPI0012D39F03|nr:SET and MYND domain-containing protein 4-like [Contarinia nasturtii]